MNTNTVSIKKKKKSEKHEFKLHFQSIYWFSSSLFYKNRVWRFSFIEYLSHLFIKHSILEISSIKMLVKIHPGYRTD